MFSVDARLGISIANDEMILVIDTAHIWTEHDGIGRLVSDLLLNGLASVRDELFAVESTHQIEFFPIVGKELHVSTTALLTGLIFDFILHDEGTGREIEGFD